MATRKSTRRITRNEKEPDMPTRTITTRSVYKTLSKPAQTAIAKPVKSAVSKRKCSAKAAKKKKEKSKKKQLTKKREKKAAPVKRFFQIRFVQLTLSDCLNVFNKMNAVSFARTQRTCHYVKNAIRANYMHIGVPLNKDLVVCLCDPFSLKMVTTVCIKDDIFDTTENYIYRVPLSGDNSSLGGFTFNTFQAVGDPGRGEPFIPFKDAEKKLIISFLLSRKWRNHNAILTQHTDKSLVGVTKPKTAIVNFFQAEYHNTIDFLIIDPHESAEPLVGWDHLASQRLKFIQVNAGNMSTTSMRDSFISLYETWKSNKHGKVKLVEFAQIDEGEAEFETQVYIARDNLHKRLGGFLGKKQTIRSQKMMERDFTSSRNRKTSQYAVSTLSAGCGGRKFVVACHCYSIEQLANSRTPVYFLSIRAYLDHDGPIPMTYNPINKTDLL